MAEIDGLQFARTGMEISGHLPVDQVPRLVALGCTTAGLDYTLTGASSDRGKPALKISLTGSGEMSCQRCLEPVAVDLSVLELSGSLQEIEAADDDVDRVVAGHAMDVASLVEDEAILMLPMVPRHERCAMADKLPAADETAAAVVKKASPFSVLVALKKDAKP